MNISLKQVGAALASIGVGDNHIEAATLELRNLLSELDGVTVKGRKNVDIMLGCMMALDAIIGEGKDGGQNNK